MGLNEKVDKNYVASVRKGAEVRMAIERANAYSAELKESGYKVEYIGSPKRGYIREVKITREVNI